MSKTEENLNEAFAGESQARNKYTFFAEKAEDEEKPGIAKLFRAAALAERFHAKNHFRTLDKINSTEENLEAAIQGENQEHTEMYPKFVETAKEEDEEEAKKVLDYARRVEEKHEKFYREASEALKEDEDLEDDWQVCSVCGNTFRGEVPEKCPICGAPKSKFVKVE